MPNTGHGQHNYVTDPVPYGQTDTQTKNNMPSNHSIPGHKNEIQIYILRKHTGSLHYLTHKVMFQKFEYLLLKHQAPDYKSLEGDGTHCTPWSIGGNLGKVYHQCRGS